MLLETASDDWFVDLDEDGIPELAAIGRLPARTLDQVSAMVAKIVAYEHAEGDWTRALSLVADASGPNDDDFAGSSHDLRSLLPAGFTAHEIFRGPMGTAAARAELLQRLQDGQGLVNSWAMARCSCGATIC